MALRNMTSRSTTPVGIFQGCDTVTGEGLSMALHGTTVKTGGYSRVSYQVCEGIQELCESIGITQSLTASFWSVASISQKLEFVNSLKLTTHSTCIVVSAKHITGKETATNWHLDPDITPPKGDSELLNFFRVYGDSFLSSCTSGGEYYAVYTFYAETEERQSELTAELHAEGLFSVVTVSASVQAKLSKMSSTHTTRVSLDQIVSGIANPHFPSADNIIQFALDFPSSPLTSPVLTNLETTGYEHVPNIGTSFDVIAANRRLLAGLNPKLVLLKQLQNDIGDISDIYSFYGGYDVDTKLVQVKREAEQDAKDVKDCIRLFEEAPTKTLSTPKLGSLGNGTPSLRFDIQRTHAYEGDFTGTPFDDVDKLAYLQKKTRISALQFRLITHSDFKRVISYFKVIYSSTEGSRVIERGRGNVGELTEELLLLPAGQSMISAVSGNVAVESDTVQYWRTIGFDLSDRRKVLYGKLPVGYRWEVPKGCFLLGFSGHFGSYLVDLQCVYASFLPAFWARAA